MLGSTVCRQLWRAPKSCHRADIQYGAATLRQHLPDLVLHAEEDTFGIDRKIDVQIALLSIQQRFHRRRHAGVIDTDIEPAEIFDPGLHQRFDVGFTTDITVHGKHLGTAGPQ